MIAVSIPTTLPFASTKTAGIAVVDRGIRLNVVVVRQSMMLRLSPLTRPPLTDIPTENALPTANTGSPTWSLSLSPRTRWAACGRHQP